MPKIKKTCNRCGKVFQIERWRLKDTRRGKFCSRECKGNSLCEINNNFFSIQTADMAYVLGLFVSDGCVTKRSDGKYALCLKRIDRNLLVKVHKVMNSTYGIYYSGTTDAGNNIYKIEFVNPKMIADVEKYGVVPKKTFTAFYPDQLSDEFASDFIRGVFDGDGCVGVYLRKGRINSYDRCFNILGTHNLLYGIQKRLPVVSGIKKYGKICNLRVFGIDNLKDLYKFFYPAHDTSCLGRKRKRFIETITKGTDDLIAVSSFSRTKPGGVEHVSCFNRKRPTRIRDGGRKRNA